MSTLYIGWSWAAQSIVERNVNEALAEMGIPDAPVFLTPTPLNTLLWRVVVMTDEGHLEGLDSLMVDEGAMQFNAYPSDVIALEQASDLWSVSRLRWFAQDFVKARVEDEQLIISDLRMGQEPFYVFSHVVAERDNPHWRAIPAKHLSIAPGERFIAETWQRIWSE